VKINLAKALRADRETKKAAVISFVGAGGKTTALFQLARDLLSNPQASVLVTATSHLGLWQTKFSDHHIIAAQQNDLKDLPATGITLITGEIQGDRTGPINNTTLNWLREYAHARNLPLLIEADGSRQKSLKAPAAHEPPIPEFSDTVIVFAGLGSLGLPLSDDHVHRAELFAPLSGLKPGQHITADAVLHVLTHPQGGLKNIPPPARRVAFLNQADTPALQSVGGSLARALLGQYDSVLVGSLQDAHFQTFEHCAGIVLAAGESTRFGSAKQLLDWKGKPFVRQVAETALQAGLWPVVVVSGAYAEGVNSALAGLPVTIVHNAQYQQGQSTSIRAGLRALPQNIGACVFLLADQPQIPVAVIQALSQSHTKNLESILAPLVLEERRANPVLFDRVTFPDLLQLTGDVGGRGIFDKHHVQYLPWHDDILLFDVDKPEDYQRLKEME
jgi:molybdenum cofactor cytidylyltransferase